MKQKIIDKGLYIQIMRCSLEERMENKIEFINKVYMGKEAKSGKKVFSVIAGVLFAIVLIGSFLIAGGVGGISVSVLGLVVYNLSNTGGKKTSTYILTVAFFEVDSEGVVLTHSLIDYNDKLGIRDEINSMKWDAIKGISYSEELNSICIDGKGEKKTIWKSEKRKERSPRKKAINRIILYLPYDSKDKLNSHIAKVLADLGHTDTICISDCGLPVPEGVQKIDLALEFGIPSFEQVVSLITKHMKIEAIHIAKEMKDFNPKGHAFLESTFPCDDFEWITTSHDAFKEATRQCKCIIRTGEASPYANIILRADCIFSDRP